MKKFEEASANKNNPKWNKIISREEEIYTRPNELRSNFERDYNRIVHTNAYRRLKHKTQVFFSPKNDHICTRIEHVNHVESISYTIANYLGLNTELTKAIAVAHDIGHSPFGHKGEHELSEIAKKDLGYPLWHEKSGLHFVDNIELLEDERSNTFNLNLTYAVRDGIISHCGEVDQNGIKPREEAIDLNVYTMPNQYAPYTWEGCVVKVADKISYIGRDIEDAISLNLLDEEQKDELSNIIETTGFDNLNNSIIIHELIQDLCANSNLETGITLSDNYFSMLNKIKQFNYKNIYLCKRMNATNRYFHLVINEIYETLKQCYNGSKTKEELKKMKRFYPMTTQGFMEWIEKYWNLTNREETNYRNKVIYFIERKEDYLRAILDYITGMTDNYAIELYNEIISF